MPGGPYRISPRCAVYVAAVLLLSILPVRSVAQNKSWRIAEFKDTISINRDGGAFVSENITLVFVGAWHGIHRTIPIEYPGPHGTNFTLFVDVKRVADQKGKKLKFESKKS